MFNYLNPTKMLLILLIQGGSHIVNQLWFFNFTIYFCQKNFSIIYIHGRILVTN